MFAQALHEMLCACNDRRCGCGEEGMFALVIKKKGVFEADTQMSVLRSSFRFVLCLDLYLLVLYVDHEAELQFSSPFKIMFI